MFYRLICEHEGCKAFFHTTHGLKRHRREVHLEDVPMRPYKRKADLRNSTSRDVRHCGVVAKKSPNRPSGGGSPREVMTSSSSSSSGSEYHSRSGTGSPQENINATIDDEFSVLQRDHRLLLCRAGEATLKHLEVLVAHGRTLEEALSMTRAKLQE